MNESIEVFRGVCTLAAGDTANSRLPGRRVIAYAACAYAACAWALAFAVVHLYWALGGTVGLPPGMSVGMNPALFVIDVIAVPLCVAGALLALSLVRPWGHLFPRRLLLVCAWAACALLILHSAPTLLEGGLVVAGLRDGDLSLLERWSLFVYEPWFFIGGVLYGAAAWGYGRRPPRLGPYPCWLPDNCPKKYRIDETALGRRFLERP